MTIETSWFEDANTDRWVTLVVPASPALAPSAFSRLCGTAAAVVAAAVCAAAGAPVRAGAALARPSVAVNASRAIATVNTAIRGAVWMPSIG